MPVLSVAAIAAFAIGAIAGAGGSSYTRTLATGFVAAWTKADYAAMYADIDAASKRSTSQAAFAALYQEAAGLTTTLGATAGKPRELANGSFVVPVTVRTRMFGMLRSSYTLRFAGSESSPRIAWSASLEFPGLAAGMRLKRRTFLPPRAALLTRTGSVLASGEALAAGERSSPLGAAASGIVGTVGPVPAEEARQLQAEGVPADAIVGVSGLERTFDAQLRGRAGGVLMAGSRVIARASAHRGTNVRTTISAPIQEAAVRALGGQYGGVVAMQPLTGQILGVAGIGLDDLQPPGSTFKMVTVTGVLQYRVATPRTVFPYASSATLDGVELHNSESESCGGSLVLSFAVSCNSVFAPLGVKLGAARLVATAERYGFNHEAGLPGVPESTVPHASEIQGELAIGSTAIGQDAVLASPLEMGVVAATIGDGGLRPTPTFSLGGPPASIRVTPAGIAREVRAMMIAVVQEGTGTSAAIPGVTVAGKTGTAELGPPAGCSSSESGAGSESSSQSSACKPTGAAAHADTDAWFAAFAPALSPRIAVAVLMVKDGFGGETAAPVAKEVLEAGLG
ncbi:MAG: penicillin-binding transpeptidase domain-containing protein [Solirubrobacteraceae bacterium]